MIVFLAQVRRDEVLELAVVEASQQFGGGAVVEVTEGACYALAQSLRITAGSQHFRVVVAFQDQRVAAAQRCFDMPGGTTYIGEHAEPARAIAENKHEPAVVVVPAETDGAVVALAETVGALAATVEQAATVAAEAAETAETAAALAESALVAAAESEVEAEPLPEDEPEQEQTEDTGPGKVHWTHRSLRSFFGDK